MVRQYAILRCEPGKWWRLEGEEGLVKHMKTFVPTARVEPDGKACMSPLGKHHIFELLGMFEGFGYSPMSGAAVGVNGGVSSETYLLCSPGADEYEEAEGGAEAQYEEQLQLKELPQRPSRNTQLEHSRHGIGGKGGKGGRGGGAKGEAGHGFDDVMAALIEGGQDGVDDGADDAYLSPVAKAAPGPKRAVPKTAPMTPGIPKPAAHVTGAAAAVAAALASAAAMQGVKGKGKGNVVAGLLARNAARVQPY